MVGFLLRATFGTVVLGLVGYVAVTVPVGRRTVFEHAIAIARTQPARDFAEDVGAAARVAAERVRMSLDR